MQATSENENVISPIWRLIAFSFSFLSFMTTWVYAGVYAVRGHSTATPTPARCRKSFYILVVVPSAWLIENKIATKLVYRYI